MRQENKPSTIRLAKAGDLAAILQVERSCEEAPQWGESVWQQLLADREADPRCVMVAIGDSDVMGFVVMGTASDIAEIESVAVQSAARGQGIGKALCRAGMEWAAKRGAIAVELEVRASNALAQQMYAGLGFVTQGVRKRYYRSPAEDAVLMSVPLIAREL